MGGGGGGGDTPLILIQLERKTRRSRFRAFIDVQETFTYYKFDKIQAIYSRYLHFHSTTISYLQVLQNVYKVIFHMWFYSTLHESNVFQLEFGILCSMYVYKETREMFRGI
jgi:hypothetical protein